MDKRTIIFKKAKGRCSHCGKEIKKGTFTIDHFIPKSYFGTYCIQNLFPLCRKCNEDRGNQIVNAKEFYLYAEPSFIYEAEQYFLNWKQNYTNCYFSFSDEEKSVI